MGRPTTVRAVPIHSCPTPPAMPVALAAPTARRLPLALVLFGVLGTADLVLTAWLLRQHEGGVYEANPVARWLLETCGWPGMILLKLASVLLAGGVCLILWRRRPQLGRRVFAFACGITGIVVGYSGCLAVALEADSSLDAAAEARAMQAQRQHLDDRLAAQVEYQAVLTAVCQDLVDGNCGLAAAVARLQDTTQGRDPGWMKSLHVFWPDNTDAECLALSLLRHVSLLAKDDTTTAGRLTGEYRELFGYDIPQVPAPVVSEEPPAAEPPPVDLESGEEECIVCRAASEEPQEPTTVALPRCTGRRRPRVLTTAVRFCVLCVLPPVQRVALARPVGACGDVPEEAFARMSGTQGRFYSARFP
jgi:hypothetical protein